MRPSIAAVVALAALSLAFPTPTAADTVALTDDTIQDAVELWMKGGDDRASAQTLYGTAMSDWDTSRVTNMERLFRNQVDFNEDITTWNTAKVTSMQLMFYGASSFTHDLSAWQVAQVTNFGGMFVGAASLYASLCWPTMDWTAFVEDIFCGTAGASFDPCCVDESIVMASCCGNNQACSAFCVQNEWTNEWTDTTDTNEGLDKEPTTDAPVVVVEGGMNATDNMGDGDSTSSSGTSAVIDKDDLIQEMGEDMTLDPPVVDSLAFDQDTPVGNNGRLADSATDSDENQWQKTLIGSMGGLIGLIALVALALFAQKRRQEQQLVLDPDASTLAGKQVPTLDANEEESSNGEQSDYNLNDVTLADTEAPSLAGGGSSIANSDHMAIVQQTYFDPQNDSGDGADEAFELSYPIPSGDSRLE